MKNKKWAAAVCCAVLGFGLFAAGCSGTRAVDVPEDMPVNVENTPEGSEAEGNAAELGSLKSFSAVGLNGETFTQDNLAEKDVTVLNFWSLTCGPCVEEMPEIGGFASRLPENVQILTVCLDGRMDEETAKNILNEAGFEGVTLVAGDGDFLTVCSNLMYTPTTVFADSEGNLVGDAVIGRQRSLEETYLDAINVVLRKDGKDEISLAES